MAESNLLDVVAVLRLVERLLAVGIGGMSIYLGYRLFLALPNLHGASGEFRLPMDIHIVIGRAGPGAFFALFGSVVVGLSVYVTVHYELTAASANRHAGIEPLTETHSFTGLGNRQVADDARAKTRVLLVRDFVALNSLGDKLRREISDEERADLAGLVRRVKLKLLEPVWEDTWGDPIKFEEWIESNRAEPPGTFAEAAALYFASAPARP